MNFSFLFAVVVLHYHMVVSSFGYDDFNNICQKIWQEDKNRVSMNRYYRVNIQDKIYDPWSNQDKAFSPLFSYLDRTILNKPTYKSFLALLDNYERSVGKTENMTPTENSETRQFLRDISTTGPIRVLHQYLTGRGMASTSMDKFLQELFKMWFYRYKRKAYRDSSGFEHVFVGEISDKSGHEAMVTGFHNWLQFYRLEKYKQVDYRGYLKYYTTEPSRIKLQLYWNQYKKMITSMFLGTSPEFEIAIYTLCFMVQPGKSCQCKINGQDIHITSYKFGRSDYLIGTAYLNV